MFRGIAGLTSIIDNFSGRCQRRDANGV